MFLFLSNKYLFFMYTNTTNKNINIIIIFLFLLNKHKPFIIINPIIILSYVFVIILSAQ
jgi:hypothetical protein